MVIVHVSQATVIVSQPTNCHYDSTCKSVHIVSQVSLVFSYDCNSRKFTWQEIYLIINIFVNTQGFSNFLKELFNTKHTEHKT